ncbi:hypothetical protein LguiB_034977 [Lonicera macranthoides]
MSVQNHSSDMVESMVRPVGGTEHSWCRAVSSGTGNTVLALQLSKEHDISLFQNALHKLQNAHPILNSKLHKNTATNTFYFTTPRNPTLQLHPPLILSHPQHPSLSPLQAVLERELNTDAWSDSGSLSSVRTDLFFASVYALPGSEWVVVLRLHTAACDRTTALSLLNELMELMIGEGAGTAKGIEEKGEVSLGIEDLIPSGKSKKSLWAHGLDTLGYSLNSLKLTNLKFKDVKRPRCSEVVRLKLTKQDTHTIMAGCKSRGIKLCGVLVAAGLMAAHSSKCRVDQSRKKYGVVTLIDCRSIVEPPLLAQNYGFYHSAVLNIHHVKGGENLWDLASKSYMAFANSKKCNKHFSDMADLNFLMCKAIDNPGLTASSSLRSSLISVFEDPVFDNSSKMQRELGVEDYIGCSSVHGIGPSIAIFDTIRDGQLDCACVYPSPLHSREQMQELVDNMKTVLVDGTY